MSGSDARMVVVGREEVGCEEGFGAEEENSSSDTSSEKMSSSLVASDWEGLEVASVDWGGASDMVVSSAAAGGEEPGDTE